MGDERGFNRILVSFRDELDRPEYRRLHESLQCLVDRMLARELELRRDFARDWENAHVLLELERLAAGGPLHRILSFGGGNSPICYWLAESGLRVEVLDTDPNVEAAIRRNAAAIGVGDRLTARTYDGKAWPHPDACYDCILSISVFEGLLRKQRSLFFSEARRVLRPGGSLLLTFDYGEGARWVSDPPTSIAEIHEQILTPSGMELVGKGPSEPEFDPEHGPPVKQVVPAADGQDRRVAEYSFGAVHLRNPLSRATRSRPASPG